MPKCTYGLKNKDSLDVAFAASWDLLVVQCNLDNHSMLGVCAGLQILLDYKSVGSVQKPLFLKQSVF